MPRGRRAQGPQAAAEVPELVCCLHGIGLERGLGPYDRSVRILLGLNPAPGCDRRGFAGEALWMRACVQADEGEEWRFAVRIASVDADGHGQSGDLGLAPSAVDCQ
jgi:hypothetical protein